MALVVLASSPQPRKLRVGVFADASLQPRWVVEALANVARSECAEIVALRVEEGKRPAPPSRRALYGALDRWLFGPDHCEPVDLPTHVPHRDLAQPDLDVAFAVGEADDSALDGIARLGVWRLALDGAGEVARGEPLTGAALTVRLAAGTPARLAYESWGRTDALSVARNRRAAAQKAAEIPVRALREAQRAGRAWLEQCRLAASPSRGKGEALLPAFKNLLRHALEKTSAVEQWSLAFRLGAEEAYRRITPPRGRDWADPCVLAHQGRYWVFFSDGGRIAVLEIAPDGRASPPRTALERAYPVSHPFVFEDQGRLYMVPQSAHNRSVELYRCAEFPLVWRLEKVLLEGVRLVDATLHRGPERWWLFANGAAGESAVFDDELHLFHAPGLAGDWQPYRRNPLKSDARSSRPAGRLYWRNGALLRPAQICVPRRGAGIVLHRVLRLTPADYAERQVERVFPSEGWHGMRTMSRAGALTVVDVLTRRLRFA
jgi:hypothetical protein